jgi:Amt family ammonium transporter
MKAVSRVLIILGLIALAVPSPARAQASPSPAPTPTTDQRLARLEAYIANTDPGKPVAIPATGAMPGPGPNAWMMTASLLVFFMTIPGLALSYGGLVRRKNVLSVLAQCMGIAGLSTILWWAVGYSLAFAPGHPWLGDLRYAMLHRVGPAPNADYAPWVSQNVFAMFELMFAIITPAIIIGATAERTRFAAVLTFIGGWLLVVYYPVCHMVWGVDGAMNGLNNPKAIIKAVDFAGGLVVHLTSGWSSLVICMMVGKRMGYGKEKMPPHSIVLCMLGTSMLWVGWYGFNAGSAFGADGVASNAFITTTLSAAVGASAWAFAEWVRSKKSSVLGFCSGAIGGLVIMSPCAGYISASSAVLLGVIGGLFPYFAIVKLKMMLGYDDALDAFGVHAINGTLGILAAGFLARVSINPKLGVNLGGIVGKTLWLQQFEAILVTMAISIIGTFVVGFLVNLFVGLRPLQDAESLGLDLSEHGEEGYIQ